jgi:hypothetical protein
MNLETIEKYTELTHYTNSSGLKGIIDSQSLWASNARFLNDAKEMEFFFETRGKDIISEAVNLAIASGQLSIDRSKINALVNELSENTREITLSITSAHILSLCGNKNSVVAKNGLLSQWRAYGASGGYAIVFDTKEILKNIKNEFKLHRYQRCIIAEVEYYESNLKADSKNNEVASAEKVFKDSVIGLLTPGTNHDEIQKGYDAVTYLSCLYKHWGFHEENEVRIVAIPLHSKFHEESENHGESRPVKEVKSFLRNGCVVPYIELFLSNHALGHKLALPVKRIIVGPHREQKMRADSLRYLEPISKLVFGIVAWFSEKMKCNISREIPHIQKLKFRENGHFSILR